MDWMAQIIDDFGRRIGLPGLALDEKSRLRMALEDGTGLGMMQVNGRNSAEIIVYRSCPLAYLNAQSFRTVLRLADFRQPNMWAIQAGISQRELVVAIRIPERAFSNTSLDYALNRLLECIKNLHK